MTGKASGFIALVRAILPLTGKTGEGDRIRRLFVILLLCLLPMMAEASDSVLIGEYQIQLFTEPHPLMAEEEATLFIKILHSDDHSPVRGGRVFVSTQETLSSVKTDGLNLNNSSSFREAKETDEFGNYEFSATFQKADTYYVKVAIEELEGNRFSPPLTAGFSVPVSPGRGTNIGLIFTLLLISLITVLTLYIISIRRRLSGTGSAFNILDISWIKKIFKWRYIQPLFQIPLLMLFIILITLAFIDIQDGGKNLSTKLIWTIWWAGIIFTFVVIGRLWCFMCPVGGVSEWVSRLFKPQRLFPPWLRNVWLPNIIFVLLTWFDVQLGVVRSPMVTGYILTGLTATAVLVAIFFQRRTFCKHLCPIGGLIGIYSMFSAVELRSNEPDVCRSHNRKDCYLGNDNGYGCPMFEMIPALDSNNNCNFCGECIKTCPKENITLRVRTFFRDAWTTKKRRLDEASLAVVLVGVSIFVTGDMLEPWAGWMESAMRLIPADVLGIKYRYTLEVITKSILYFSVSILLIPGLMLIATGVSNRLSGSENHNGLKQTFITFGYMFIPVGLSMHLAHNTAHLLNESGGLIPAIQRAVKKYTPFSIGEPDWTLAVKTLVHPTVLYWLQMGLLLTFFVFSLYAGYRLSMNYYKDLNTGFKALIPMVILSFLLMSVNVYLLNLPMAPRHVH